MKKKHNFIIYCLFGVVALGLVLEFVGLFALSPALDIGMNTNISPLAYVGAALVLVALIAYFVIGALTKRGVLDTDTTLRDILMLVCVIALIVAVLLIPVVMIWPAIFPANG